MKLYDTVHIGEHFVAALEYGDFTGLSDEEEKMLQDWCNHMPWQTYLAWSNDTDLRTCEISGLLDMCFTTEVYIMDDEPLL